MRHCAATKQGYRGSRSFLLRRLRLWNRLKAVANVSWPRPELGRERWGGALVDHRPVQQLLPEVLARLEVRNPFRRDLDHFAGLGVAARARVPMADAKRAKPTQLDPLATEKSIIDARCHGRDARVCL